MGFGIGSRRTLRHVGPAVALAVLACGGAFAQDELEPRSLRTVSSPENFTDSVSENSPPPPGTANSLETRVKELERQLAKTAAEAKKKKAADAEKTTLNLSGRIHLDVWTFPESDPLINVIERQSLTESPEDRVQFRRARLAAAGTIPNDMVYKIELEFAAGTSQYRDVYLGFTDLPLLQTVLIGNQKRPFNLDQLNSSRFNVFMERPYVAGAFDDDASRRIGIQSYGNSDDEAYNWRYGAFMSQLAQSNAGPIGDPWQGEIAGRFANTYLYDEADDGRTYAHWAVSGAYVDSARNSGTGSTGTGSQVSSVRTFSRPAARTTNSWLDTGVIVNNADFTEIGLESLVNVGPWQFVSEWSGTHVRMLPGAGADKFFHGYYAYASYFLTGEHIPWNRKLGIIGRVKPQANFFFVRDCRDACANGWGAWQVAARYDYCDLNDQGVFGGIGSAFTLALNWHWNPHAKFQLNYIRGRIEDRATASNGIGGIFGSNVNALDPVPNAGDYGILGCRFAVDF